MTNKTRLIDSYKISDASEIIRIEIGEMVTQAQEHNWKKKKISNKLNEITDYIEWIKGKLKDSKSHFKIESPNCAELVETDDLI